MITISKEDYLKAIAEAEAEGKTVIPATLAHWLSVTRPAVTFALKRLTKDGLVSIKSDGHIRLTPQGREIAERTILRHHLIERMLSEIFGMAMVRGPRRGRDGWSMRCLRRSRRNWSKSWATKTPVLTATDWPCVVPRNAASEECAC